MLTGTSGRELPAEVRAPAAAGSAPVRFQSGNSRDFVVNAGHWRHPLARQKRAYLQGYSALRRVPRSALPCRKVEGFRKALHLRGFPRSWAGAPDARLGHFPRLLSLHCLNRGFLASPGGPVRACDPASETGSTRPPGALAAPGDGDVSGAKRRGARPVERGCGARAPKGARRRSVVSSLMNWQRDLPQRDAPLSGPGAPRAARPPFAPGRGTARLDVRRFSRATVRRRLASRR